MMPQSLQRNLLDASLFVLLDAVMNSSTYLAFLFRSIKTGVNNSSEDHVRVIRMQQNKLVNHITCIDDIKTALFQNGKLTALEFERLSKSHPLEACVELLTIIFKKPRHVYECFLEALIKTEQHHVYEMLTNPVTDIDVQCFSEHSRAIRQHLTLLIENIEPGTLLDYLLQMKVVTRREHEDIVSTAGASKMNEALLQLIMRKSPEQFLKFKKALNNTHQEHVVTILNDWKKDDKEHQSTMVVKHKNRNAIVHETSREENVSSYTDMIKELFDSRIRKLSLNEDSFEKHISEDSEEDDDNSYTAHLNDVYCCGISSTPYFDISRIQARSSLILRSRPKLSEKLKEFDDTLQKEVSLKLACLNKDRFGERVNKNTRHPWFIWTVKTLLQEL